MIEWRVERNLGALVGCNGAQQVGVAGRSAEHPLEGLAILANAGDPGDGRIQVGLTHFGWVDDRKPRLLLQRPCPAVPELRRVVKGVQNSRRIALPNTALDTNRDAPSIRERTRGIVTATTRDRAVCRQAPVEEQLLSEGNFVRCLWIVGRYRRAGRLDRETCLFERPGPSQLTGAWDGQEIRLRLRPYRAAATAPNSYSHRPEYQHGPDVGFAYAAQTTRLLHDPLPRPERSDLSRRRRAVP